MTETTMRDLFDRLVDEGAPPGVGLPVEEVMLRNGRVLRRRRTRRVGSVGALVAAVAAVAVVLPNLSGSDPALPATPPSTVGSPAPTRAPTALPGPDATLPLPSPSTTDPTSWAREEARNRGRAEAMMERLVAMIPSVYTVPPDQGGGDTESGFRVRDTGWYLSRSTAYGKPRTPELSYAVLEVRLDGRAALLTFQAITVSSPPPTPASLCETRMNPQEENCRVVHTRDGSPVRIAGWRTPAGPTRQAVRFYDDMYVQLEQSSHPRTGVYGLGRAVLSDEDLAALVADPAFGP